MITFSGFLFLIAAPMWFYENLYKDSLIKHEGEEKTDNVNQDSIPFNNEDAWNVINKTVSDTEESAYQIIDNITDYESSDVIEDIKEVAINPTEAIIEDIIKIIDENRKKVEEHLEEIVVEPIDNHADDSKKNGSQPEEDNDLIEIIFYPASKVIAILILIAAIWLFLLEARINKKEAELFQK